MALLLTGKESDRQTRLWLAQRKNNDIRLRLKRYDTPRAISTATCSVGKLPSAFRINYSHGG
jgi:hypothetical protein